MYFNIIKESIYSFVFQRIYLIFAPIEPAKPLDNAQIGGSFFL